MTNKEKRKIALLACDAIAREFIKRKIKVEEAISIQWFRDHYIREEIKEHKEKTYAYDAQLILKKHGFIRLGSERDMFLTSEGYKQLVNEGKFVTILHSFEY